MRRGLGPNAATRWPPLDRTRPTSRRARAPAARREHHGDRLPARSKTASSPARGEHAGTSRNGPTRDWGSADVAASGLPSRAGAPRSRARARRPQLVRAAGCPRHRAKRARPVLQADVDLVGVRFGAGACDRRPDRGPEDIAASRPGVERHDDRDLGVGVALAAARDASLPICRCGGSRYTAP
jgi:hypothetical protein